LTAPLTYDHGHASEQRTRQLRSTRRSVVLLMLFLLIGISLIIAL